MAKMNRHASRIRSWIILAIFFIGAIAGFFGENSSLESASFVTRIDVLHEWARVLRTLRPLLKNETLSSFRMPPYSDFPFENDDMAVAVLGAGLMQGYADGRFLPERQMSRGEGVLAAGRLEEFIRSCLRSLPKKRERHPEYSDILEGHWLFDSLSRLGGIGALTAFGGERFLPDQVLSGVELRSIGNDIIEYYGQDVAIIESTPEGLAVSLKAAIGELSPRDFRYCWAGGVWRMMPESGVIPWEERKSGGRLHIAAAEWTVTPTDVVPLKGHVWYAAVRRNTTEAIKERRGSKKNMTENVPALHLDTADEHTRKRLEAHLNALYARLHRNASAPASERPVPPSVLDANTVENVSRPVSEPVPSGQDQLDAPVLATEDAPRATQSSPAPSAADADKEERVQQPAPADKNGLIQVAGCLLDSLNRRPIGGATVLIGTKDITTDKDGTFRFQVRKDSLHEVTAYAEGYEALALKYRAGFRNAPLVIQLRPVIVSFVGTVTNAETGEPISGARVKLDGQSVITSSIGEFRIPRVAATYHQMACSAPGYMETFEIAYVDADGKPYNIQLKPLASSGAGSEGVRIPEVLSSAPSDDMVVPDE